MLLRLEGWPVNAKRVYRLYREEGLRLRVRRPQRRRSAALWVSLPEPTGPNQIWSMDLVNDELGWG